MLALHHYNSCLAVHTCNPDLPTPTLTQNPSTFLTYHLARLTNARFSLFSFGYTPADFASASSTSTNSFASSSTSSSATFASTHRPQTTSYSLCDSPAGLLALVLDAVHGHGGGNGETGSEADITAWTVTDILSWTMMQWLPGPEAGLRWLRQASAEASADLWNKYSSVPLGVSQFGGGGSPPGWASAWQKLSWARRHEAAARWPAWEKSDLLVIDLREWVAEMVEEGHVGFASGNVEAEAHGN